VRDFTICSHCCGYVTRCYLGLYTYIYIFIYLLPAIGLSPGGSGYFTCIQNMKLVTTEFK